MPKTRIYCHGVHDFCQEGHERQLLQAKYALPDVHLVVGVISDETHGKQQMNKLLYNELERYELLLHCKHVDEVLIANVPWKIDQPFLDKHKIDFVTITDRHTEKLFIDDPFVQQLITSGKYLKLKSDFISDSKPKQLDDNLFDKIAPFSDEPIAIEKRNKCSYDFNKRISYDQAKAMGPERPIRVYADGIYDMFHPGHARQLKQAKLAFPHVHLMVGVVNDELTKRYKGPHKGPLVVPEDWRYDRVRHCRYVDEVVRDAPWIIDETFLIENKIDFVAHDDEPYILVNTEDEEQSMKDVYKHIKDLGMFVATNRMEGISTTDLKVRLKKRFQDC